MRRIKPVAAFYLISVIICLVAESFDIFADYSYFVWIEIAFALCVIGFAATRWADIRPLYSFRNVSPFRFITIGLLAVCLAVLVNLFAHYINIHFFEEEINIIAPYLVYSNTALIFIFSVAVFPAIIEELGYRAYIFNSIRDIAGSSSAIAISSMSFAIAHRNLTSLFWLIPFAFWMGYLRNKYDTLWYGIAAHFMFNLTTCVWELYQYGELPFKGLVNYFTV